MNINYKKIMAPALAVSIMLGACNKDKFREDNTDPTTLYSVEPENQFLNGTVPAHSNDFEWFYDFYRRIMPWVQLSTNANGNAKTFIEEAGNFNQRYGIFYGGVGNKLVDVGKLIERMTPEEQAKRVHMKAIPNVLLAYYAFYTSDVNGSIPFSEAFQARYGGTFTPKYDTQEELFSNLDNLLKSTIATLKTTQSTAQISLAKYDLYYGGDVTKWVKAANALRLKIALRLIKRDPAKLATIAREVLASPATDLMSQESDSWVFDATANFTGGGNWNPTGFRAPYATVNFMKTTSDPRIRNFYHKNKWNDYVGSVASPDAAELPANRRLYTTVDTLSNIQYRLFVASFNGGTGINNFPIITYADFCFMRAELAQRNITTESASSWYNAGVEASIRMYDKWAKDAKIEQPTFPGFVDGYTAVSSTEITNYLNHATVKYDAAKGLEQICTQAYINYYKQPNEAWALWKRTGLPNNTTALSLERLFADGVEQTPPRRAPIIVLPNSELNYANNKAALEQMAKEAGFGSAPSDVKGRVWWDKP